jgi:endonuclease III
MATHDSSGPKKARRLRPVHHAADFGLDVMSGDDDLFRWFLLTFLLGKPIQSTVAVKTWRLFLEQKLDFPWAILDVSDYGLVGLLHQGGYTRYQHVMTKALKTCMQQLVDGYDGSLELMIENSFDEDELAKRLQKLYGVGPKTAEIFMRETEEYFARRVE